MSSAPSPHRLPPLSELGCDLLQVSRPEAFRSLAFPFLLTAGFFVLMAKGWWLPALLCPVLLSFFTYASISHDLVHRTLGLPGPLNEFLLAATELLALRSGHAYRISHLHHHARFPAEDDMEGAAARMTFGRALLDGTTLQFRIYAAALRRGKDRGWIVAEGIAALALFAASGAALPWSGIPLLYCVLVVAGSWAYPLATSWIPHRAEGADALAQTRLVRNPFLQILTFEHLYHLEHHLYPQVPHHRWPELARRLDPHFSRIGRLPDPLWR